MALTVRRRALLAAASAALASRPARAQTASPPVVNAIGFLASSATLRQRASALAASRDTRPEVKAFAAEEANASVSDLERLRSFARARGFDLPQEMELDHQSIWDNLEPLDYLALSRRYAEVELQALERDAQMYEQAGQSAEADVRALAAEMLPRLRGRLEKAKQIYEAVKA